MKKLSFAENSKDCSAALWAGSFDCLHAVFHDRLFRILDLNLHLVLHTSSLYHVFPPKSVNYLPIDSLVYKFLGFVTTADALTIGQSDA
jgi:hypothetical protein